MAGYRELEVWQKSYALALDVYRATRSFPQHELFGLTSQLRRSAVSIPANVAEGHSRHTSTDYLHFVAIARGSAAELDTLISLASDLSYLDAQAARCLVGALASVQQMLTRLAQSLRTMETQRRQGPAPPGQSGRPRPPTPDSRPPTMPPRPPTPDSRPPTMPTG